MSFPFISSPPLASMTDPSSTSRVEYAFNSKIMVAAMVILFIVVFFVASLHMYAKWFWRPRTMSSPLGARGVSWRRRRRHRLRLDSASDESFVANMCVGLDSSTINSLPTFTYQAPGQPDAEPLLECAVCLSEFQACENCRFLPNCKHSFHTNCIDMWFHLHSTCPLCRTPVLSVLEHPIPLQRDFPPPLLQTVASSTAYQQEELNTSAQGISSPLSFLRNDGASPSPTTHHPHDEQSTCIEGDSSSPALPHSFAHHRQHQEGLANNASTAPRALQSAPVTTLSRASNGRLLCKGDTHGGSSHMSLHCVGTSGSCSTRLMSTEILRQPECAGRGIARCVSLNMPRGSSEDHNQACSLQALKSPSFRMSIKWLLSRESSKGRSRVFPSSQGSTEIEPSTSNSNMSV